MDLRFSSDIVGCIDRLNCKLPRPLILQEIPGNFFEKASLTGLRRVKTLYIILTRKRHDRDSESVTNVTPSQDVIYNAASRMNPVIGPQIWARWGEQVARLP